MSERNYLTGLLCLTTFFLFADQNCLSPNMSEVAREFNFSDEEKDAKLGGEIALGFFMIGGIVSVLVGALADTMNRCKLFMWIVVLGEISCIGTYLVTNYEQLLFCRILTGVSIGGCAPIVYSILGDCFPASSRVYISTYMGLSMTAGVASGQLLAGLLGPTYGWRFPFVVIAIPAIICGILVFLTATEPKRGGNITDNISKSSDAIVDADLSDSSSSQSHLESFQLNKIVDLLKTPTVALCYLQGIPGCIPWSILTVFMSDYLSSDRGLSISQATFVFTLFGFGGLFGQLTGGWVGQYLYNRDKRLQCLFMGAATLSAVVPMLSIMTTEFEPVDPKMKASLAAGNATPVMLSLSFMVCVVCTGFVAAIAGPNVRSVLQVILIGIDIFIFDSFKSFYSHL